MLDLYIKNADGILLVYSITAASTFRTIPEQLKEIYSVKPQVPVILVGNKVKNRSLYFFNDKA
jgi:GTPase SAR1 family protein